MAKALTKRSTTRKARETIGAGKKKRKRTVKSVAKETKTVARRARAIDLRLRGYGLREIAKELKVSVSQAHRDVEAVMKQMREKANESAERHLQISLERLDRAIKGLMPGVDAGSPRACEVLGKLEERRAKLLGIDKPQRLEHSGPDGEPIEIDARTTLLERLAGLIAGEETQGGAGGDTQEPHP